MPLDYPIAVRELPNGLRVVVSSDRSVPTVSVNLWVGVGSRHEEPGHTGFAHLFEHLMFQGSRNVAEGEHFATLLAQGARLNATTWFDRTNYFETVPTGAYELALWLEADRHGGLLDAVTQECLDNQRDVVKEEKRQRYDNRPYGNALVDIYATVFPDGHPYQHPTIGSMADLDAASLQDVHDFFRAHYAPNNTVLTLVGDLSEEEGFAAAERYFGSLAAVNVVDRPVPPLAPLDSPVRLQRVEEVPEDRLYVAFRLPAADAPDFLAAELAFDVLAAGATSRLYRRLVRGSQQATHAGRSVMGLAAGVSLGYFFFDAADGVSLETLETALVEELTALVEQPPSEVEMEVLLADTERWWLQSLAAQDERADLLSQYTLLYDDPDFINTYLDRVAQVTSADIARVAAQWLRPESRAVVTYEVKA